VLVLTPDFPPAAGGIQLLIHRLVRHLDGVRCRVVTVASAGCADFDRREPLDVRRVPSPGGARRLGHLLLNARALTEAVAFRPHAVLSAHLVVSPAAATIARLTRVPFAQYLHADELRARPRLAAFAVRQAGVVLAVSRYTERLAIEAGAPPTRVRLVPNGVDIPDRPRAARESEPTVLTVARLNERYKGFDVMARALPLVRARVPEVRWVIVGDGRLRPHVEQLVQAESIAGMVELTGELADGERDAWLDRAHLFAMPSRVPASGSGGEGFGIAYLEAAAHGLPVVAGDAGGATDAVVHRQTGLLVDPTDHLAVADAVSELLLDRGHAEALGRAGAERAREFAWPRIARQVECIILELADWCPAAA
jgi:phosphatidylinositol alpha-1,6-mannosyltransferase